MKGEQSVEGDIEMMLYVQECIYSGIQKTDARLNLHPFLSISSIFDYRVMISTGTLKILATFRIVSI